MTGSRGVILVLAYLRPQLLTELFESITRLTSVESVSIVVVRQIGNDSVGSVIKNWQHMIEILIETDGSKESAAENISRNRLAGYAVAFDSMRADWVLAVEDDVLLASDAILFSQSVYQKYQSRRNFRAINLGSRLVRSELGATTYCLTRFGVYGQASVLPRSTWQKMRRFGIVESASSGHWDSAMEAFVKTGFCVTPNNSRYLDRGWVEATHMSSNPDEDYYKDLKASFVGHNDLPDLAFSRTDLGYWWRSDLTKYQSWKNLNYWVAFSIVSPFAAKTYRRFRKFYEMLQRK